MEKKSSGFVSNVLKLTGGNIIAIGITVLVSPVLTRLYDPKAFGIAALFISICAIIGIIICLRYELAIILPKEDEDASSLFAVSLFFVFVITLLTILLILFNSQSIVHLLKAPALSGYLWLIPVMVLMAGIYLALNYWNSRTKHFGHLSIARIISSGTGASTQLGAGIAGYTYAGGLIGGQVIGQFFSTIFLGIRSWRNNRDLLKIGFSWKRMLEGMKRYRKFPIIDIWGGLINTISWHLPVLLLSFFFSPIIVGFYALTNRVIRMPMVLIGRSIGQVFYQKACESKNTGDITNVVENVYARLVAIGLFPFFLLSIIGQDLFVVVFGEKWIEAGRYVQILSPCMFFVFISSPLSTLFATFERQGSALIVHSAIFISRLVSLVIGGMLNNVYLALALFSGSGILVYGGLVIWNMKLANISITHTISILFKYFAYFFPVALFLLIFKWLLKLSPFAIVALSVVILVLYLLMIIYQDKALRLIFSSMICRRNR